MTEQNFDYIVVGGGSAGCIVAARLAQQKNTSVLLLEAGQAAEKNPDTLTADGFKYCFANDNVMWDRLTVPQKHSANRTIYNGTGTGMGGSGSVNGMVYTRGDKRDFDQWPQGWHWQDIEASFQALEQTLDIRSREGTVFTEKVLEAAEAVGLKRKHGMNDGDLAGVMGYNTMNFKDDTRRSSYVAFIKDKPFDALRVITQARAEKIQFNANRAVAVEYRHKGKHCVATANKEIILTAGALESPKLLMLSGVGPKAHLQQLGIDVVYDSPNIGANLHDHPNVCLFVTGKQAIDFGYPQVYGFNRMNKDLDLVEAHPDTCIAMLAAPLTIQQSMYRMVPATLLPPKLFFNRVIRKLFRPLINIVFALPNVKKMIKKTYGFVVILGKPESRGTVRLASKDASVAALVDPNYFAQEADLDTMVQGILKVKEMAKTASLKSWGANFLIPATRSNNADTLKKWIRKNMITTFHFCGTCAMGEQAERPVSVDLKVKGVEGLRVADASVMPVIPVSALNAPSMMIAYRAADFILQQQS